MSSKYISKNVAKIKPSGIRKFFDIVSTMPDALSLGVGEPDFVTPWEYRDSAVKSIQKGHTAYTSNWGMIELREEIALYLKNRFSLDYNPQDEICVTVGASEGIDLALRTVVNPGDEVIVCEPSYVSYIPNIELVGGVCVTVKTKASERFKLTKKALEQAITSKTKAIILPFPNNPTGAVMSKEELQEIVPLIEKHDLIVITDEIYAELSYDKKHVSIASFKGLKDRTIFISGFSKAFAMTGWRLGYVCASKEIATAMVKVHQYTIMCAPTVSQYAGLSALRSGRENNYETIKQMKESYDMRRRFLTNAFNEIGLECFEPHGAFYCFPSVKSTGLTGEEFAEKLLLSQKVAVVPGVAFGDSGKYFIRTCYACSMPVLTEAVDRIQKFVTSIK